MPDPQAAMAEELLRRRQPPLAALQKAESIGADPMGDSQWKNAQMPLSMGDLQGLQGLTSILRKFRPEELTSIGEDLFHMLAGESRPIQIGETLKDVDPRNYAGKFQFSKNGGGGFHAERFPHTADIRVHHAGDFPMANPDQIKGLNPGHAAARAAAAYPSADRVRMISREPGLATLDLPDNGMQAGPGQFHMLDNLIRLLGGGQ